MNWFVNITGLLFAIASLGSIFFAEDGREALLLAFAGFGALAILLIMAIAEADSNHPDETPDIISEQMKGMLK